MTWKKGNAKVLADSEDSLQAQCFEWFHNTFPLCRGIMYHIPNGGLRNEVEANKLKAMGVTEGVPDLHFALPSHREGRYFASLYLELKKPKTGRHSPGQLSEQEILRRAGNCVLECRTVEDFKKYITAWLEESEFKYK